MAIEIDALGEETLLEMWLETGGMTTRDRLVAYHLPLVNRLCRRFQHQGEPMDRLIQVGTIGLIKAIYDYDPRRGNKLAAFAIPVVVREIKNYFRGHGWAVRLPRSLQRQKLLVDHTVETLTRRLGRSPTVAQICRATGLSQEEVHHTFDVEQIGQPWSLNAERCPDEWKESAHDLDYLGEEDPELESLIHDIDLKPALTDVDP